MSDASDTTNRRKRRTLYTDRVVQTTTFEKGLKNRIILEGGVHTGIGSMTYEPNYYDAEEGALVTTVAERDALIASVPSLLPNPPVNVSAVGGAGEATVSFSPSPLPSISPTIFYTVVSNPGGVTATGTGSPIVVSGLSAGPLYTFRVYATNKNGRSELSLPSNSVSLGAPPDAPSAVGAIAGTNRASIYFTTPFDGGSPITDYEYSTDDGSTWSSAGTTTSPLSILGLVLGTVYAIRIRAVNVLGAGTQSAAVSVAGLSSFDPTNITGMNVWLDGQVIANAVISAGKVSTWTDRSGSANNFTASAGGTITYDLPSGINARPAMNFTTSAPSLSTYLGKDNFNIAPTNQLSVFLVVRQTATGASGNSELFFTRNDYTYLDMFSRTNSDGILCLNIGSATTNSTSVDIITSPPTNALISLVADTTASMFVNGATTPVSGATRGPASLNNATLDWAISGGAFLGNIGEVMCYSAPLNTTQRQAVEGYLAWKWGLQGSLPGGHPYVSTPPTLTLPAAPSSLVGTPDNTAASIAFTAGSNGGSAITNYQYSTDGGATFTAFSPAQTASPVSITGLTNGVAYSIALKAVTAFGVSDASSTVSVTPARVISGSPNVLILGDASAPTLVSGLQSAKTDLGYTGTMTITTKNVFGADSGYTGGDLSTYNVVILYTNGGATPSSTLGGNLNTYVTGGGKLIMGVFAWGNPPSFPGLTYATSSTYGYTGGQGSVGSAITNVGSHPIQSGITPTITISGFYSPGVTLTAGSSTIATYGPSGTSFIAVSESGSTKLVGLNIYPVPGAWSDSNKNKNIYRYFLNSIYWCIGSLT